MAYLTDPFLPGFMTAHTALKIPNRYPSGHLLQMRDLLGE